MSQSDIAYFDNFHQQQKKSIVVSHDKSQSHQFNGCSHLMIIDIDITLGDGDAAVACDFLQNPDAYTFGRQSC